MALDLRADLPGHLVVARQAQSALLAARRSGDPEHAAAAMLSAIAALEQEVLALRHEIGEHHAGAHPHGRAPVVDDDLL